LGVINFTGDNLKLKCSRLPVGLLIFLAIAAMYTLTLAQDPNDPGLPDTIWVDCSTKAVPDTGGWVTFTVYLKTDNQGTNNDITGLYLPLYLSSKSSNDSAQVDTTVSLVFANSALNDSDILSVTVDSVTLDGFVALGAVKFSGTGLLSGVYTLGQLWIHLSDSTSITIDTTSRVGNGLLLVTSDGTGYVPSWKKITCSVSLCSGSSGDVNGSGGTPNLQDVIYLVNFVFDKSRLNPPCNGTDPGNCWTFAPLCRGDANGSGGTPNLQDVIYLVNFVFDKSRLSPPCNGADPGNCWTPVASDLCCSTLP